MRKTVKNWKSKVESSLLLGLISLNGFASAAEISRPDLPPVAQVESALSNHLLVKNATSNLKMEQANLRRWNSGPYEFNLRAGSSQRKIINAGQTLKEWDVALERALRLPNKVALDQDIGEASMQRATFAIGDARHEAGRTLLKLWYVWQREQAQANLWQRQLDILKLQAQMTEKRVKAGDAPKLELNQVVAIQSQSAVSLHQAQLRAQLAANDLARQYPAIKLPENLTPATPEAVEHDFAFWKSKIFDDNHELAMIQAQNRVQQLLTQRSHADRLPDPTVGLRYANEMGGNEKITGVYLTVPISFGQRSAIAEGATQQAAITADQEAFVTRRVEGDIYATHIQAVKSYETWLQAHEAAQAIRNNAELIARAYSFGEMSLSDSLTARRLALESSMAENQAQLDANEARYRLLLDAHQLWALDDAHEQ